MLSALDNSVGGVLVGVFGGCFLFGTSCIQVYIYYSQERPKDPWRIRILVPLVWFIDALQTALTVQFLYTMTVTDYANTAALSKLTYHWEWNTSAFFDGLIGALVQGFFAHRIYVLSHRWWIPAISVFGSLVVLSLDIVILYVAQHLEGFHVSIFDDKYRPLVITVLVTQMTVDLINTTSLCVLLRAERTGIRSTDNVLHTLFMRTIETGMITSLAAILMLILCLVSPDSTLWVSIAIFYAKLYSNSFMVSLNSRASLRDAFDDRDFVDMPVISHASTLQFTGPSQHAPKAMKLSPRPNTSDSVDSESQGASADFFKILEAGPMDGAQRC